jgi:hypothetical protein
LAALDNHLILIADAKGNYLLNDGKLVKVEPTIIGNNRYATTYLGLHFEVYTAVEYTMAMEKEIIRDRMLTSIESLNNIAV